MSAHDASTPSVAVPAARLDLQGRLSDWLNPILVRELQQALNGRIFLITLGLSLVAVTVIAMLAVLGYRMEQEIGDDVFVATMLTMAPILVFVVPFQAFLSMRQEVSGGTAEILLLSRLTPRRIVAGKIAASMVHFVLFYAVFAPLIALTFLLRGVDVPMIAVGLGLACLMCLATTALAVAFGALCRWRLVTPLLWGAVTVALGAITAGCMGLGAHVLGQTSRWMHELWFWQALSAWVVGVSYAMVLFGVIARSMLTHPNENRSTPFRLLGFAALPLALAVVLLVVERRWLFEVLWVVSIVVQMVLIPFGLFAVTEDDELSPRVRTLVPRRRALALLSAPFLPGGARGFCFVVATSLVLSALTGILAVFATPLARDVRLLRYSWFASLYVVVYLALARLWRARMRRGALRTWIVRLCMPLVFVFVMLIPMLLEVLVNGDVHEHSLLHILNPFLMLNRNNDMEAKLALLGVIAGVLVAVNLPGMFAGANEVLEAAAARRARERDRAA